MKKDVLKNFENFTAKHLCQSLIFDKVGLWHRCFPVKLAKFLRTASIFVNFELLVIVCSGVSNATLNKKMSAVYKLLLLQKIEENACSSSRIETLEIDIKYVPSDRKDTN